MQHRDIPDGQRHEPKGISTATDGQVYVANGNGSGSWQDREIIAYGQLTTENKEYTISTGGTYVNVDGLTAGLATNVTLNAAAGTLTTSVTAIYELSMNAVVASSVNQTRDITFRFLVNNVAGSRTITTTSLESGEKLHVGGKQFVSLEAGDVLNIQITANGAMAITASGMDLTLKRVE